MILNSEDITLRPWKESDAENLYNLAKSPNIGPKAGWPPHKSVEESLEVIKTIFSNKETYAIIYKNQLVGCVGLLFYPNCHQDWGKDSAEIGYWLSDDAVGYGYMTEAVKALETNAFKKGLNRIVIRTDAKNVRSDSVPKRCGYCLEGTLRSCRWDATHKRFTDIHIWSKLKSEWIAEQKK